MVDRLPPIKAHTRRREDFFLALVASMGVAAREGIPGYIWGLIPAFFNVGVAAHHVTVSVPPYYVYNRLSVTLGHLFLNYHDIYID